MTALRTLTHDYHQVLALAQDPDVPLQALRDTLEGIEGEFNDKAVSLVDTVLNADTDIHAIDEEIKRLHGQKRLKDYLRENMGACEIKKIECPLFTITLAAGRDMAVVSDEQALPDDMVRVTTSISPDKAAILKALKGGEDIPGAHLQKSQSSIRIK